MPLAEWLARGWLTAHQTSKDEVAGLLALIARDLENSQISGVHADWRFQIAYNAGLQAATLALAACGYRASRQDAHIHTIDTLAWTVPGGSAFVAPLQAARRKRNIGTYEREGVASDQEAQEMHSLAEALRDVVLGWLRAEHAELL